MYVRTCIFSICIVVCLTITTDLFARGETPPPPPFEGGNAGDWLGDGPIFGFKHPWGFDMPGDQHGNFDNGEYGYGWGGGRDPGHGNYDPGPNSCSCGPENECNTINHYRCEHHMAGYCEAWCACTVLLPKGTPPKGAILLGACTRMASPRTEPNGCAVAGGTCSIHYGIDPHY